MYLECTRSHCRILYDHQIITDLLTIYRDIYIYIYIYIILGTNRIPDALDMTNPYPWS